MQNNFQYRIYYEDTDAGGVVYYANYLKFFERARTDFLRELGISQTELAQKQNLLFVVKKATIDYVSPAMLDDLIDVSVSIKEIRAASVVMTQEIKKLDVILAQLEVEIVCVETNSFKVRRLPSSIANLK